MLHLSDLHFGCDQDETAKSQRALLLDSLLERSELSDVDVVLITGDIAWHCKEDGYEEAGIWLKKLRGKVKAGAEFISCCGNHDVEHAECTELQYINDADKILETLRFENLGKLQRRFQHYIKFCEKHQFKKLSLNGEENYLIGSTTVDDVLFWVFNSAWYALNGGEQDQHHLWLGRSFFDLMDAERRKTKCAYIATLMHHPKEWLNENEIQTTNRNKSLFEMIAQNSDLCFTGHTHGNIQKPNIYLSHMNTYSAGATYAAPDYYHNFSIFDLDRDIGKITRLPFESIDGREWHPCEKQLSGLQIKDHPKIDIVGPLQASDLDTAVKSNGQLLWEMLEQIKASLIRISESDLAVNRTIIWPVVPRKTLTTIHLAQLELMNLLCRDLGWSIKAIISNCGANPMPDKEVAEFEEKIKRYCMRTEVDKFECTLLRDYFAQGNPNASDVLDSFLKCSSATILPELTAIKNKKYTEEKIKEVSRLPVLDYILPVLQMAVVNVVARQLERDSGQKPVVLAGNDERKQWTHTISIIGGDDIGAILIPELNMSGEKTVNQDSDNGQLKKIIQCVSKEDIEESFSMGNIARWLYQMFVVIPHYRSPAKIKELGLFFIPPSNPIGFWTTDTTIPACVNQEKLIDYVWRRLEKGNICIR